MRFRRTRPRYTPNLDITPLVDAMFILLIFTLTTMTFAQNQQSSAKEAIIDIELAKSSTAPDASPAEALTVLINASGNYYLSDSAHPLSGQDLQLAISEKLLSTPALAINVKADHRATHGQVVSALDLLKSLNIQHVNLVIELTSP